MAKRASQAFATSVSGYKRFYEKNEVVPADIAKKLPELTYDDGSKATAKAQAGDD